ncbi:hypothetical protein K443DRAFT_576632 [Laccaria amethystina LaAM-08-1]|uniref:Uncharacterized protein n=1 Tax=Laccaria amethystina LaAM-08-1 TaxID=1095629 RepID=A0A0C9XHY4_9AGAR|nr:hypothetical protein K443DRAFT_576632 [Laccaria amethystina LaAM-08-1]
MYQPARGHYYKRSFLLFYLLTSRPSIHPLQVPPPPPHHVLPFPSLPRLFTLHVVTQPHPHPDSTHIIRRTLTECCTPNLFPPFLVCLLPSTFPPSLSLSVQVAKPGLLCLYNQQVPNE